MKIALFIPLFFLLLFFHSAYPAAAQEQNNPRAVRIIEAFERKLNLEGFDITADFTLVQKRPREADRVLRIEIYRRDAAELFTIIFTYPDSETGKGYLRQSDDLYLYLPATREFVYRNRKDDIGSTDVRTDIFGRLTNLEKFRAADAGTATVSQWECDVVRLDAKVLDVTFPIQKWYIRKTDGLPVKVENFSASETLLRTFYYVDFRELAAGKYIFTRFLAVNHLEEGQRTLITIDNIRTTRIDDYVFTKAYLERRSR
ncbi:MAG TPA: outer membrane lipoprotein-sorting protein [Spirochaetia bacterium]|nr:outer membrane lipoprotein-sorting protein [Spirochaetia bacterium]